jgi:hypothetical protein
MLVQQQSIQFSEHSSLYDLIDFPFIYDELLNYIKTKWLFKKQNITKKKQNINTRSKPKIAS